MKKLILSMLLLLSVVAPFAAHAEDSLTISPTDLVVDENKTATIQFNLVNEVPYHGFQADIALPAGLTVESVPTASSRTNAFIIDNETVSTGLRVVVYSHNGSLIGPGEGSIMEMKVSVDDKFTGGEIKVSKIIFTTTDFKDQPFADITKTLGVAVSGITLDKPTAELQVGGTVELKATVTPENATDKTITWTSSNETIATVETVDGKVIVTANAIGSAIITATTGGQSASCTVTVIATPVESITISPTVLNLKVGGTGSVSANVLPATATDKSVTWTSNDENVATVSAEGVVTAVGVGTTKITATSTSNTEVTASIPVTVASNFIDVESIEIAPTELTLYANKEGEKTAVITATLTPASPTDPTITWTSSVPDVASVVDGKVTALKNGTTVIKATASNGLSKECTVTVKTVVEKVTLTDATIAKGETLKLTPTINPTDASDQTVTWESGNTSVATVDAEGVVTAIATGTATITATAGGVAGTCTITVNNPATAVTLSAETAKLKVGETATLTATVTPEDADDTTVTWTSDNEAVATVDANGKVTAKALGEATITATCGAASATCKVTVIATPVESVTLDKTELSLTEGESETLTATVAPENATDKTVTWTSSDAAVATVKNGVVTAVAAGTAKITAKAGDATATCDVTVAAKTIAVTGVTLDKTELSLTEGETATLTATVAPSNATDKKVTWSSDNEAVATVKNGVVTAVAAGTAKITATAGGQSATCDVTVVADDRTSVPVKMTYVNMNEADTSYGEIAAGETAKAGYNKISGGSVAFANEGWGVNYITYLQVNVSELNGTILNATLTFEASGSTDNKRTTGWGVGYNSSVWSADMTYNTADKSITTLGDVKWTTTKSAATFEKFSFDITEAVSHAENGLVTILVYETAAAGGYIKNPEVKVKWTEAQTYPVTFTETNGVEASVIVNKLDVTEGTSLPDGTYTFSATAKGYEDYSGEFTVAGAPLEVKYTMTPKAVWNWTVKNNVNDKVKTGTCFAGESATVAYNRYILAENGTVWMKAPCGGDKKLEYNYTFTPTDNNFEETLEYSEYKTDGIYFIEAEEMEGMTASTANNANIRCSNSAGAYPTDAAVPVAVKTLAPGNYKVEIAFMGGRNTDTDPTFFVKAGEQTVLKGTTNGSWTNPVSEEFELTEETVITVEGGTSSRPLDYILITGTVKSAVVEVTEITLNVTEKILKVGETLALVATVAQEDATDPTVTWTSSDETVATVDKTTGLVTAVSVGKATITAKAGEATATCALKCYPQLGDAKMDGGVTLADAVEIANYVVGNKEVAEADLEYFTAAADANEDSSISISDALATVDIVLTNDADSGSGAPSRIAAADNNADKLVIGGKKTVNGKSHIAVSLVNSKEYVALQADIFVPEGVNFDVIPGSRICDSNTFQYYRFDDTHVRIAIFSIGKTAFYDNDEPIFEIVTDSSDLDPNDITLTKILASDADANEFLLSTGYDGTTGVAIFGFDNNEPVKVYDLNGRCISDKEEGLEKGIYIVRQGNNAKKVQVK